MLNGKSLIYLKKDSSLNTNVLKFVLEKKFNVRFSKKPDFSSENLSKIAEKSFSEIIKGNFDKIKQENTNLFYPLYNLSDKEIELYARFNNIKGKKRKENKRIKALFEKFIRKNPDLEHNIIKAVEQLE